MMSKDMVLLGGMLLAITIGALAAWWDLQAQRERRVPLGHERCGEDIRRVREALIAMIMACEEGRTGQ